MPTININGKDCEFEKGQMILQVATANGIEIPHYCYHDGLSIVASCRVCLVEVWAPNPRNENKLEPIPKLLPACQTPAGENQMVYLDSPKVLANQKAVLEYLLINHPLDCPVCDQAGECLLQDYSYSYGRGESRFEEEKNKQPKKDLGENVYLYSDRCIMCTRCVRFTREITGTCELGVVGRGSTEQIDLFPGKALDNELSGNVVDICPVGALLDKDFQFSQRVWFLTQTPSIDGLTASGDNISIEHNNGQIYRIKPRTNTEVNNWWISNEIRYGWKFVYSPDRVLNPIRAQHGERTVTTFASAYKEINDILTKVSSTDGSVAALISPMLTCEEAYLIADYARCWNADRSKAILGIGPVPMVGENKTFPPQAAEDDPKAYTIRAEKAPNARGVQRVLEAFAKSAEGGSNPLNFEQWLEAIKDADVVIITGNYPNPDWTPKDMPKALAKKFVILVDTLPNALTQKADIVLPGAAWVEKAGTFENVNHKLQSFKRAFTPIENSRDEGQIFTDLINIAEGKKLNEAPMFKAADIRKRLVTQLGLNEFDDLSCDSKLSIVTVESDMEYLTL